MGKLSLKELQILKMKNGLHKIIVGMILEVRFFILLGKTAYGASCVIGNSREFSITQEAQTCQ